MPGTPLLTGLPPVAGARVRVLVLGSMPGAVSLEARRYYAHPRNLFWPLMGALIGAGPELPYTARLARLQARGLALWDVLQHCRRRGSLDAAIRADTEVPNDFAAFFAAQPQLRAVFFNGRKAEQAFLRRVRPQLAAPLPALVGLPSTSPANAAVPAAEKLRRWRELLDWLP